MSPDEVVFGLSLPLFLIALAGCWYLQQDAGVLSRLAFVGFLLLLQAFAGAFAVFICEFTDFEFSDVFPATVTLLSVFAGIELVQYKLHLLFPGVVPAPAAETDETHLAYPPDSIQQPFL